MATEITLVKSSSVITIGRRGEGNVHEIHFDISDWVSLYGDGTVQLLHKRSQDQTPYPVNVSVDDRATVKWLISKADTAYAGSGRAEMRYYVDDMLKVSKTWETIVKETMIGGYPEDPPEAEKSWVDKVLQAGTDAENAATRAANSEALADQFAQQVINSTDDAYKFSEVAKVAAEEAKRYAQMAQEDANGTLDHDKLSNRDFADAHPIHAITGLAKELKRIEAIALQGSGGIKEIPIASIDVAGVVKPGTEFVVAEDGAMSIAAVEIKKISGLEERLAAIEKIDLSGYATRDEVYDVAQLTKYEIFSKPYGTLVNYSEDEIRVMCPADTQWVKQSVGPTGNSNMYYMGFKAYAPAGATCFKEDLAEIIADPEMYYFEGNEFAGVDKYGRKYSIVWLPLAQYDESTGEWTYFGENSTDGKYVGWNYSVEWYDSNGVKVAADMIRINLSNEDCHMGTYYPSYVAELKSSVAVLEENAAWKTF